MTFWYDMVHVSKNFFKNSWIFTQWKKRWSKVSVWWAQKWHFPSDKPIFDSRNSVYITLCVHFHWWSLILLAVGQEWRFLHNTFQSKSLSNSVFHLDCTFGVVVLNSYLRFMDTTKLVSFCKNNADSRSLQAKQELHRYSADEIESKILSKWNAA